MNLSLRLFIFLLLLGSCKSDPVPAPEPLDPVLVELVGEDYKEYIVEEIKPATSDTIQMLSFEKPHYVFDLKSSVKQMSHRFAYHNTGDTISYVQLTTSACNCMHDNSEKEMLNPGESAELNITFDPRLWAVSESKSLYVFTKHYPHQVELIIERNK